MAGRPTTATPPRRRRTARGWFVLAVLAAAALLTGVTWAAGEGPTHASPTDTVAMSETIGRSAAAKQETPQTSPAKAQQFQDGERVYLRDCAWCHGPQGEGSELAPSLKESGPAAAHFWLTTGRMPLVSPQDKPEPGPPAYPPKTMDALITYVGTLGEGPEIPEVLPGDVYRGRTLFLYNCAPCHSSGGTGMILPAGDFAPDLFSDTPTQVAEAVRLGPGPMPPFGERHLDKEQVDAIATYVQQLGRKQDIGGQPLDWIGPIYEGAVAWLLGIPVLVLVIRLLGKKAKERKAQ